MIHFLSVFGESAEVLSQGVLRSLSEGKSRLRYQGFVFFAHQSRLA